MNWSVRHIILLLITAFGLNGQSELFGQQRQAILSKNFKFEDGVYISYQDFKNNQPTYRWDTLEVVLYSNPNNFITRVQSLKIKNSNPIKTIPVNSLWGLSLGGIPHIRMVDFPVEEGLHSFAGIRLRGKICYFFYEKEVMSKVAMPVYNPLTQQPYQKAFIERLKKIKIESILHFETGKIAPFEVDTFKSWIEEEDPALLRSMNELTPAEMEEKLFRCLLIYDDRNYVEVNIW